MAPTPPSSSGSRRPYRKGRVAKLPMMNNSERGKYYRQKYKEHEVSLEAAVAKLRKQVRDLELFMHVREELAYRNPSDSCESVVGLIYEYFVRERADGLRYETSFQATAQADASTAAHPTAATQARGSAPLDLSSMQSMMRAWGSDSSGDMGVANTFLFFDLLSFQVEGCVDAPVVIMRGMVHTKYTPTTIDRLFPHLIHYQDLLEVLVDKEVRYPCAYHFYFGSGGTFKNKIVEADYVIGLLQAVESLDDVVWLLDGSHRYKPHRDSLEDIMRGPTTMSLDFILS